MKRVLSYLMAFTLVFGALNGFTFPIFGAVDGFASSFETTDANINPQVVSSSGVGYSMTTESTVVSASGEYTNFDGIPTVVPNTIGYGGGEGPENLVDADQTNKICMISNVVLPFSVTFKYTSAIAPKAYYITTANDDFENTSRRLNTWTIEGSTDGTTWFQLDSRAAVQWSPTAANPYQKQMFAVRSNLGSYTYIRLNVTRTGTGAGVSSNPGVVQFSGFGMYSDCQTTGIDGTTWYDGFQLSTGAGPAQLWGNTSSRANMGWTGSRALKATGIKRQANANSSQIIYDNVDVTVNSDTKLSYMIMPYINSDLKNTSNADIPDNYDYEYTNNFAAIDLKFDDGTFLSQYGAKDQYGVEVSPLGQGNGRIVEQNNWLKVTSSIGAIPALRSKTIKSILVGYAKNGGTPGKEINVYFDDVKLYREADPIVTNLADYVNILRGTQNGAYNEDHNKYAHGLNNPIVATPHPFNFWSPATTMSAQTVYQYAGSEANFKQIEINHVASNWIGESGTFDISADSTTVWSSANALYTSLNTRGSVFKHENEIARAHYYGVTFNDNDAKAPGVKIEVTPTEHAAVLRFTFPAGAAKRNVILDCAKSRSSSTSGITNNGDGTFSAFTTKASNGQKRMYIYGQFSVVPSAFRQPATNYTPMSMFEFAAAPSGATVVELKIATSYMSAAQAIKNLNLEIDTNDNFDSIKAKALETWNNKLSVIKIDDPNATYDQLSLIYSNLYRAFVYPLLDSENTGTAENPKWQYPSPYSGNTTTSTIKDGRLFYNNGFWDTYRTAWPLYSLLTPQKDTDLLNGLVQHYLDNGWIPRWIAPAGTDSMVGTNSDSIFGDAISQGVNFDFENAYYSSLKNATVYSPNNNSNFYSGRAGMAVWPFIGYSPTTSLTDENLSWSLEAGVADFGIMSVAKALRDKETPGSEAYRKLNDEYLYFLNRSRNYVYEFNPALGGWFRGKTAAGEWLWPDSLFDPVAMGYGYTESNAWNYAFHAPQDGRGLANLYGGQDKLGDKLDEMFSAQSSTGFGNWSGWHKEKVEARGDKLGQMHMSNQLAHHIPYMYLFTDRPWKTAEVVRDILDRHFAGSDIGQGYIGDDDNGEMSSWYVLSALGLYPLENGNGQFVFGTPLFSKATIKRDNGQTITITAPGVSATNKYVQSVKVNGVSTTKSYLTPADIYNGATIEFAMGSTPSQTFGVGLSNQPPSLTSDDKAPNPLKDLTTALRPSTTTMPSGNADGAYTNGTTPAALFDNTSATYTTWGSGSKFIYYYFNNSAIVDMYTITNWTSATSPTEWTLSGSNNAQNWTVLDTRANQTFAWDRYTRPFSVATPAKYKYYRLEITNSSADTRISQFELIGNESSAADKDSLYDLIQRAQAVEGSLYGLETYQAMLLELQNALSIYNDANATNEDVAAELGRLSNALNGLILIKSAGILFEGVDCNYASSGVKKESTSGVTGVVTGEISNLGGLTSGSWVGYRYLDFGGGQYYWDNAKVIYSGKQSDLSGSRIIVHLDALDGPTIADFALSATGTDWSVYQYASGALSQNNITGLHTIYYEFRGNGTSVANIHAFVFESSTTPNLGKVINRFTPDSLTTSLKYQNETNAVENLSLYTAIYTADGRLTNVAKVDHSVAPSSVVDFELVINAAGIKAQCLQGDYSVGVFLWDSVTYVPVMAKYYEKSSIIVLQQELDEAKTAIEAGEYKIPAAIVEQNEKIAWVRDKVNSYVPAGNPTVVTVSFNGGVYTVKLINDSIESGATINVSQQILVTFSAPDADGGYSVVVEAGATGTVSLPTAPVRTDYKFIGWYIKNADGDWRFTSDTVVTSNSIVSAKWMSAPTSVPYAAIMFDSPMYNKDITVINYNTATNSEVGARATAFRDDVAGRIDIPSDGGYTVGRYMYCQLPSTYPNLRSVTNLVFEITYYDIGTNSISFETADTTKTGTERNYGNRHNIPRSNSGALVTYKLYLSNVGMQRGQNNSCDFRINGGSTAPNMYIKSIVIYPGTAPAFDSIAAPNFAPQTDTNNLIGKTLAGYQLWFTSSATNSGWVHWSRGTRPTTYGQITFENWPDVREYPASVLNNSGLPALANGSPSQLFTSKNKSVVDLHFDWIEKYGLDGVAVQRFSGEVVTSETPFGNHVNMVQDAAERTGKTFYVMYDFSNCNNTTIVNNIKRDWVYSIEKKGIASSPNYAHADGKPVVCLWGLSGVASESDGNVYISQANALELISWFHDRGYYVIGGTPDNDWSLRTDSYRLVYQALDMISPWTVGRYGQTISNIVPWLDNHVPRELAYCAQYGIEYQPVIFAGFNWSSFQPAPPNDIPRAAGEMMWQQAKYLKNKGVKTAYFAMFDEYDEGTALMKTAEDSSMLPVGTTPYFQTLAADGRWVSSDFYLRLAGSVIKLLKNNDPSIAMNTPVQIPYSQGPVYWRNGFERRYQQANAKYAGGYNNVDVCLYNPAVLQATDGSITTSEMVDNSAHIGSYSLSFAGTATTAAAECSFKIADTAILAPGNLQLSYWINAQNENGKSVFVNLQFSDGTLLSKQAGFVAKAASGVGTWEQITVDLDASLAGKTINAVVVSYAGGAAGNFAANIDDIVIQVRQ